MSTSTREVVRMGGELARGSTVVLEPTDRAAAKARWFVAERFTAWGLDADDGRLIVSELVTNSLLHGKGPIVVLVFQDERDGLPVIEVRDSGGGEPVIRPENYAATSGRGLLIVACVAQTWGIRPLPEGG